MQHKLTDYDNPKSLGSRMRARRLGPLVDLMEIVFAERKQIRILDIGGRKTYWNALTRKYLEDRNTQVSILNLASEKSSSDDCIFKHITGDACDLNHFSDNSFDIVHSNSVIEHVGNWNRMVQFAGEARRLAQWHFVQTPYFWFPVEPHFIKIGHHWLPRPLRTSMWMMFQMGNRSKAQSLNEAIHKVEDEPYLVDLRTFRLLFPDSFIIKEKFLFLTKSLIAYRSPLKLSRRET